MTFVDPILAALLPIVVVVFLGWLAGVRAIVPQDGSRVLAAFVVKFALPIALFLAVAREKPQDILDLPYALALVAGLVGTYAVSYAAGRFGPKHEAGAGAMRALTCSFPNMAYCGPPVLLAAVGPSALLSVVIGNLVTSLLLVPTTLVLLERHHLAGGRMQEHEVQGLWRPVTEALSKPLVFLPLIGVAFALIGVRLPQVVVDAGDQIGRAAGGAALFTLGLILSGIRITLKRDIVFNVLLQNIVQPVLILAAGYGLGLRGDLLRAVFLIGVLPSATENAMLALANDTYRDKAAATVAASTMFALATISAGIVIARLLP